MDPLCGAADRRTTADGRESAGTIGGVRTVADASDLLPIAHESNWKDYSVPMLFTAGFALMLATALALG